MTEPDSPKPMSPEERRKLRVALAEGKVCWIEWTPGNGTTKRHKFMLNENFTLYACDDGKWYKSGVGAELWISWSEVREPRVWEGEATADVYGAFVLSIPNVKAKVRYRVEEILEETT